MVGGSVPLVLALALVQASAGSAGGGVTLSAEAGLHGLCKPGRWTPVRLDLGTETQDVSGDVSIEWGDARVTRTVDMAAPSRRRLELYIRSGDARDIITVRLRLRNREPYTVDVPVRLTAMDDPLIICAGPALASASEATCSGMLSADMLPASWRGYDAASEVRIANGSALSPEQRRALEMWRAVRRVEVSGGGAAVTGAVPEGGAVLFRLRIVLGAYALLIAAASLLWVRRRSSWVMRCAAVGAVIVVAAAAAELVGRFSPVVVHHSTVAQQFDGAPGSLISMRGVAEYSTPRRFEVTASLDGAFDAGSAGGDALAERLDADGRPLLGGVFGLGATNAFTLEGVGPFRALDVSRTAAVTRVTNVLPVALTACEWPAGLAPPPGSGLKPGESVETSHPIEGADPVVSCRFNGTPVEFAEPGAAVTTDGSTTVLYHLSTAREAR